VLEKIDEDDFEDYDQNFGVLNYQKDFDYGVAKGVKSLRPSYSN
jgi:hypothetical protein